MKRTAAWLLTVFFCLCLGMAAAEVWYCPLCGRRNEDNYCPNDGTKKPDDLLSDRKGQTVDLYDISDLSPSNKCRVQPMIYSTNRYREIGKDSGYDIRKDFSVKTIQNNRGSKEYGLYFKFTPGGKDNGYLITRFDIVIEDPKKNIIYTEGFDSDMECKKGYYWYWNFFSLQNMFEEQLDTTGTIPLGTFTLHVYFNRLWAGKTTFKVVK